MLALVVVEGSSGVKGVWVAVGVKVGRAVAVSAGIEVDTPAAGVRPKLARRQACKKASRPIKPAPLTKRLLSIPLHRVASSQMSVVRYKISDY